MGFEAERSAGRKAGGLLVRCEGLSAQGIRGVAVVFLSFSSRLWGLRWFLFVWGLF